MTQSFTSRVLAGLGALMASSVFASTLFASTAFAATTPRPVLVELFTSQGCSSCPPADALLGELAAQPGIIALAWHIDYWDRLGWKDPFSSAAATARQYDYAARLGDQQVYTPQMVIDGAAGVVGSDRQAVQALIAEARRRPAPPVTLRIESGSPDAVRVLKISAAAVDPAAIWLVDYDQQDQTSVGRGENSGRRLVEYRVVRRVTRLGLYTGKDSDFTVPASTAPGQLVILQPDHAGPILAVLDLTPFSSP